MKPKLVVDSDRAPSRETRLRRNGLCLKRVRPCPSNNHAEGYVLVDEGTGFYALGRIDGWQCETYSLKAIDQYLDSLDETKAA